MTKISANAHTSTSVGAQVGNGSDAPAKRKYLIVRAKVMRKDGTIEHHGLLSFYHKNPIINFIGQIAVKANNAYRWIAFPRNREIGRQIRASARQQGVI